MESRILRDDEIFISVGDILIKAISCVKSSEPKVQLFLNLNN